MDSAPKTWLRKQNAILQEKTFEDERHVEFQIKVKKAHGHDYTVLSSDKHRTT